MEDEQANQTETAQVDPPRTDEGEGIAVAPGTKGDAVVDQPGKLLRIAMMVRETLEEVRRAPLDADARKHLAEVHDRVLVELKATMSEPLANELARVTLPFDDDDIPTESELRIAQAQLLGWLEGLFQGIQAAIASQQTQMSTQLDQMRSRALPAGQEQEDGSHSGPYL